MATSILKQHRSLLEKYLPLPAVVPFANYMQRCPFLFRITPKRVSKYGDFRPPSSRDPKATISVNGNLNRYFFLWVLLHEMAHLETWLKHKSSVMPHGTEWQDEYRRLIREYATLGCFPEETAAPIQQYTSHLPLQKKLERQVEVLLHHYDAGYEDTPHVVLNDLTSMVTFELALHPQRRFVAIEKRRTRWKCREMGSGNLYLINGDAEVRVLDDDE